MELFEDGELFVGVINLRVPLFFTEEKTDFFKAFKLTLDIAGIFFDQFSKTANVRLEIRILSLDDYDFAADSRSYKYIQHKLFIVTSTTYDR